MSIKHVAWVERYRPNKIDDCILPANTKLMMKSFVEKGEIPNLLLTGSPGTGKTTAAIALCTELGYEYLIVNGSLEVNMDALRTTISQFASTVSFDGNRKCVIIDEGDHLDQARIQPALRGFVEQFASNCSFIITCNYPNRLLPALVSRSAVIDYSIPSGEKQSIAKSIFSRVCRILETEGIVYDTKVVGAVIMKTFPDFRKLLNTLQSYSAGGTIDEGILKNSQEEEISELVKTLQEKNFKSMRTWLAKAPNLEMHALATKLYDSAYEYMKPDSIPQLVLHLADYQYKHHFASNPQINIAAMMTAIMIDCEFL